MSALRQLSSYISSWVSAPQATSTTTSNGAPSGLKLEKLIQYPIKSCAGTQVEESEYSIAGLKHDRFWMLVDKESGKMITARTYPKCFTIQPKLDYATSQLHIHIPSQGDFSIPLTPPSDAELVEDITVWGSTDLGGHVVSPPSSPLQLALSAHIGVPVLLIAKSASHPRILGGQQYLLETFNNPSHFLTEESLEYGMDELTTDFSDGYPFLVASLRTFEAVSEWIKTHNGKEVGVQELIERYRPNIVVSGNAEPFEEDGWEELLFCHSTSASSSSSSSTDSSEAEEDATGETLYTVSRCPRCPMPDVSPSSGTMTPGFPGKTVAKYRTGSDKIHKGPCLGMNAVSKKREGRLEVGMNVVVRKRAERDDERESAWIRQEDRW